MISTCLWMPEVYKFKFHHNMYTCIHIHVATCTYTCICSCLTIFKQHGEVGAILKGDLSKQPIWKKMKKYTHRGRHKQNIYCYATHS